MRKKQSRNYSGGKYRKKTRSFQTALGWKKILTNCPALPSTPRAEREFGEEIRVDAADREAVLRAEAAVPVVQLHPEEPAVGWERAVEEGRGLRFSWEIGRF